MHDIDGSSSLTPYCGELPSDEAISRADHEPNGYFWEGIALYGAPELAEQLELDSEAGMFAAYGDRGVLEQRRVRRHRQLRPHRGGKAHFRELVDSRHGVRSA